MMKVLYFPLNARELCLIAFRTLPPSLSLALPLRRLMSLSAALRRAVLSALSLSWTGQPSHPGRAADDERDVVKVFN